MFRVALRAFLGVVGCRNGIGMEGPPETRWREVLVITSKGREANSSPEAVQFCTLEKPALTPYKSLKTPLTLIQA